MTEHAAQRSAAVTPHSAKATDIHRSPSAKPGQGWARMAYRSGPAVRVASPQDPAEREATDVAAHAGEHSAGGCHCGGTCSACKAKAIHRSETPNGQDASFYVPGDFVSRLGAGERLSGDARAKMESRFGRDFGDVRLHRGVDATAAAQSIEARAFTHGSHIAFDDHEYSPGTADGERLLTHELTHVAQQGEGAPAIQRDTNPSTQATQPAPTITTFNGFQQAVFTKAQGRLAENLEKLEEWRQFIDSTFDDVELQAQIAGTETLSLASAAQAKGEESFFEQWSSTRSPATRRLDEGVIKGEINSGCQYCHESQTVWAWNLAHPELTQGPNVAEMMQNLAWDSLSRRAAKSAEPESPLFSGPQPAQTMFPTSRTLSQTVFPTGAQSEQTASTGAASSTQATTVSMPKPPAAIAYPKPRSDLCGELPSGETPTPAPFDPQRWGPNSLMALDAAARIGPMLDPLGPAGYQILPAHVFSDLYNVGPAGLRQLVNDKFDERRDGYKRLSALIDAGVVDYKELCPIVEELLWSADEGTRRWVLIDVYQEKAAEVVLDVLMAIAGVALLFLMVLFPPAVLAVAAALGTAQILKGLSDMNRGSLYMSGTGARVFSRGQEAAGPGLYAGGAISIAQGVFTIASLGFAAQAAPGESGALAVLEKQAPGWTASELAGGQLMYTNPAVPEVTIFADAEGISVWLGDEEVGFQPWPESATSQTGTSRPLLPGQRGTTLPKQPPTNVFGGKTPAQLPAGPTEPASLPSVELTGTGGTPKQLFGAPVGPAYATAADAEAAGAGHVLEVIVRPRGGGPEIARWYEASETGSGFAGHTEQKALTRIRLTPDIEVEMTSMYGYPPCPYGGGCMNTLEGMAIQSGTDIYYNAFNAHYFFPGGG